MGRRCQICDHKDRARVELAIGLYFTAAVLIAFQLRLWPALPFLVLYQAGYLYSGLLSFGQRHAGSRVAAP